jgi:S1-C subfamily serine protease
MTLMLLHRLSALAIFSQLKPARIGQGRPRGKPPRPGLSGTVTSGIVSALDRAQP